METCASGRLSLISRSIVAASIAMFVPRIAFSGSALRHIGRQPRLVRSLELRDRYGTGAGECQFGAPHRADALRAYTPFFGNGKKQVGVSGFDQVTRLVLAEQPGISRRGGRD